jgi:flagellar assembly protein FliH
VGVDQAAVAREARERGLAEGMRTAEQAYREKLSRLDAMAAAAQVERAEFFDRMEPELVRLSVAIAEKIIGQEMAMRPEVVVDIVRAAMRRLRDREQLRVSVNPTDIEQVRVARDDLISAVDGVRKLEITEDRRVSPGGCVIESQNGTLDARIDTQLAEITAALEGAMPNVGQELYATRTGTAIGDDDDNTA